eukprot:m.53109 g.53109  ORF g.53109 m.53109 type:complete len:71 (-) comp9139_c0_seq4:86-298(-)
MLVCAFERAKDGVGRIIGARDVNLAVKRCHLIRRLAHHAAPEATLKAHGGGEKMASLAHRENLWSPPRHE